MDEFDQAVEEIETAFQIERQNRNAELESKVNGEEQAQQQWADLIDRFKALHGRNVGSTTCQFDPPVHFKYGNIQVEFRFLREAGVLALTDKMGREFETLRAEPRVELGAFCWHTFVGRQPDKQTVTTAGLPPIQMGSRLSRHLFP